MRALLPLLLLVPALAGCNGPDDDGDDIPLSCPQWVESRNISDYHGNWFHNDTIQSSNPRVDEVGRGLEHNRSRPLDRFEIDVGRITVHDGILRLTASTLDSSRRLAIEGTRSGAQTIEFEQGNHTGTYHIGLSAPGTSPDPQPIKLTWDFQPNLDGNLRTPSAAVVEYRVTLWYLQDHCI